MNAEVNEPVSTAPVVQNDEVVAETPAKSAVSKTNKSIVNVLGFVVLIVLNILALGIFGPAMISAASWPQFYGGIALVGGTLFADLYAVILTVNRSKK